MEVNFDNGLYVLSEVPGFDSSKGERISKAFQKLCSKIKQLENARQLEKQTLKETYAAGDKGFTYLDLKYELLLTQLRYVIQYLRLQNCSNSKKHNISKSTEYKESIVSGLSNGNVQDFRNDMYTRQDKNLLNAKTSDKNSWKTVGPGKNEPSKPKTPLHYHLKLDDVPFILGTSSSASHSVVANVQNIISMMKSHNKTLCDPKIHSAAFVSESKNNQDCNELLLQLSSDLQKLNLKHQELKKMFDCEKSEGNQHIRKDKEMENHLASENIQIIKPRSNCHSRPFSEPVPEQLKISRQSRHSEKRTHGPDFKQKVAYRNPNISRKKILRSLQDFKAKLSNEDVVWK